MTHRERREALTREATELEERLREMSALDDQRRALEAEREVVRRDTTVARRRALKTFGSVRDGGACAIAWDAMSGEGCVRACKRCGESVADPRHLDAKSARTLFGETPHARSDGTLMARACPRASRRRSLTRFALVTSMLLGLFAIDHAIETFVPPPAATLQYLSPRSRLGRRPAGTPRFARVAVRSSQ